MDNSFEVQSKLLRELVLAPYKQSAWGTPIPDAHLTRTQRFDGSAVIDYGNERRSDKPMSGKGSSFATNSQKTMRSVKLTGLKAEATDWNVAFVLSCLMGKIVTTGANAPYTHAITFDDGTSSARTAIPTTVYIRDTQDVATRLLDMTVSTATLTVGAKGAVMLDWDMVGTGISMDGLLAVEPVAPAENYIMGNDAVASFGPVGAAQSFLGRHMSTTIKVDNQASVLEAPGGGLYGIFVKRGDPKFSISTVIAAREIDDILVHFKNDDKMTYTLPILSGPSFGLTVTVPSCNLKTTKLGFDGDMPIWNIELDETTVYGAPGVPPISFAVNSSQPTFLGNAPGA